MTILAAITAATALVPLVSVLVGAVLGAALPTDAISIVGGIAFLGFAAWTIRGDELDDEASQAERGGRSVFFRVGLAFFLAELGDKTMLATIALATDHVWSARGWARRSGWWPRCVGDRGGSAARRTAA